MVRFGFRNNTNVSMVLGSIFFASIINYFNNSCFCCILFSLLFIYKRNLPAPPALLGREISCVDSEISV